MQARAQLFITLLLTTLLSLHAGGQQFAVLGDFNVQSGGHILDCRIGYRTFGVLNADKTNAVLWPTWFSGTSEQLAGNCGMDKFIDSTSYYIIAVDALGNGISSSPSNSIKQPGEQFPEFTIRDMVESQYKLLTEHLGITHLHAVMGISMGGMQTFQWMTAYPDFMDKAVPIVGTTTQTSYDLMLWNTQLQIIRYAQKNNATMAAAMQLVGGVHELALSTPADINHRSSVSDFYRFYAKQVKSYSEHDATDWARQLNAMMLHDISKPFSGDMKKAAASVNADVLIVIARQDHMVNPEPARQFANLLGCDLVELHSDHGHLAPGEEALISMPVVSQFLEQ